MQARASAKLSWRDGRPYSERFADVYYCNENGLEESRHVFWHGNKLSERLVAHNPNQAFVIAETGFGTGLNFLMSVAMWQQLPTPKPHIHYISVEKYPLSKAELKEALANWHPHLPQCDELIAQYPECVPGHYASRFCGGKISLSLIIGDVVSDFPDYAFSADAWYLDGFAPSKNPDMWQPALFDFIAKRSRSGASFATFTAAGHVRRGLQTSGFKVERVPGYGRKREMLAGIRSTGSSPDYFSHGTPAWQQPPRPDQTTKNEGKQVTVVGGGLAGIFTSLSLLERGFKVTLIEKRKSLLQGASGQHQLALYAKLPIKSSREARFALHAQEFSYRFLSYWQKRLRETFWHPTGLLQLAWNEKETQRINGVLNNYALPETLFCKLDQDEASRQSGVKLDSGGLWVSHSGWLSPFLLERAISNLPGLTIITNTAISSMKRNQESEQWLLESSEKEIFLASRVVLTNAHACSELLDTRAIPTKPLHGQVSKVASDCVQAPKTVICGEGYLCPELEQFVHFGASYDLNRDDEGTNDSYDRENAKSIENWLPGWLKSNAEVLSASSGLRCTTPDYHPLAGPAPNTSAFIESFAGLRVDATSCEDIPGEYFPGCYINVGHGSKGMLTAPLCAELVTSWICDAPLPVNAEQLSLLAPARFLVRQLKRKQI